jgi:hypothetical protein
MLELLERDFAVTFLVSLSKDDLPELLVHLVPFILLGRVEKILEIFEVHLTIFVGVNDLESLPNTLLFHECFAIKACCDEVLKINLAVTIDVALLYDL